MKQKTARKRPPEWVIEKRQREFEAAECDEEKNAVELAIRRKFKHGMKRVCGAKIWQKIRDAAAAEMRGEKTTDDEIGVRFGMDGPAVNKGVNHGLPISLDNLIVMLTELWKDFEFLALPVREERFTAGYQEALKYIVGSVLQRDWPGDLLCNEFFQAVAITREFNDLEIVLRENTTGLDTADWMRIVERSQRQVAEWLGIAVDELPKKGIEDYQRLRSEWTEAVELCGTAIPKGWLHWLRQKV